MKTNVLFSHCSLSHLCALLLCAFAMASNAWATEVSSTFTESDGTVGTGEPEWTVTDATGFESNGSARGIAWSKKAGTLTNTSLSSYTITKIVVVASSNEAVTNGLSITIGGSDFGSKQTISKTNNTPYTFEGSAKGTIVISTAKGSKSVWVKSVTVTYTGGSSPSCTNPTISTQPTEASYEQNATATPLTVSASGSSLTYQWYSNTTNSTSGASSISGATSSTYTPSTSVVGTTYYYCVVKSGDCSTESDIVGVEVTAAGGGETPSTGDCDVFHETWDSCDGTGGNDDKWSGSIATGTISSNNEGWNYTRGGKANECAKFGTGSAQGSATTPSIAYTGGNDLTLTFKAAAWSGDAQTVNLSATNTTLSQSSITLEDATWKTYEIKLTNVSNGFTITWKANTSSKNRFFLDEICISEATSCDDPTKALALTATKTTMTTDESSTVSVTSGTGNGEVVTYAITSDNSATGNITAAGVFTATAAGTYTIKATQPSTTGDPCTKGGTATINITVTAAPITVNIYENEMKNTSKSGVSVTPPFALPAGSDACDEWVFVGWLKGKLSSTTTAPTVLAPGTKIEESGDYYAVYRNSESSSTTTTVNQSMTDYAKNNSCTISSGNDATMYKTLTLNSDIKVSTSGEDNCGSFWGTTNTEWRLYQNKSGNIIITSTAGNITSVKITYGVKNTGTLLDASNNTVASGTEYAVNASSVTFTVGNTKTGTTNGQVQITAIEVKYGGATSITYSTAASCGPQLTASDAYVVSTKDQKVKVYVPVTAKNFTAAQTISATVSGTGFISLGFLHSGSITANATTTDTLVVQYLPTAYNTTGNATVTFSATGASATATVYGRSLPQQFAIVATGGSSGNNFAMPANTANTPPSRTGKQVTTSGTPETVEALPSTFVYTLEGVASSRYSENGIAVRLKGYSTGGYLKSVAATSAEVANLSDAATTDYYEWVLTTTDHISYNIATSNAEVAAKRSLRYYDKYFGMYNGGQQSIRLLPIGCSNMPENVVMTPTHNSVTITFTGTAATHTLVIKQSGTTKYSGTVTSGQEITGLSASTDYTYTLTPASDTDCAVEGEFSTVAAPITVTLVRHNQANETLTDVSNPYVLPDCDDACDDWTFVGWSTASCDNVTSAPAFVTQATADGTFYAVYRKNGGSGSSTSTDALAYTDFVATSTSYEDFSGVTKTSSAVYAGNNAAGNSVIQLNSKSPNGIVSTTSGGSVKTVTVTWDSHTASGRTLTIYGKNSAYTDAADLYDSDTYGTVLGSIIYETSTSLNVAELGNYTYIGIRSASGALYLGEVSIAWSVGASYTFSTAGYTDCVSCTESGASFSLGDNVTKNTESKDFTNTVNYTTTNTSAQEWSSSNSSVATVDATTGLVHIVATGEATITMKQPLDYGATSSDDDNVCAVSISYTLTVTPPTVDVVEVTADDKIIIEHDIDGESTVVIKEAQTTIVGTVADDIFFSKYYEAASNMKLFGIYNGTNTYIDLSQLRVRQSLGEATGWATASGQVGYVELGSIAKLGQDYPSYMLPPFTELVFWSNNYGSGNAATYNTKLRGCISMEIGGQTYTIDDMEEGTVPNWYCLGDPALYNTMDADGNNQFNFNGDDALILERNNGGTWEAIDIFGAGTSAAPVFPTYANKNQKPSITTATDTENGKIKEVNSADADTEKYTINGRANTRLNDNPGGWWALSTDASVTIPLSGNRYYLMRNSDVKSGANAVAQNTTRFATLGSEWHGTPIGKIPTSEDTDNADYCTSGELFSEVGQYDYASYYTTWENVSIGEEAFTKLDDGTLAVKIDNLASHSCNTLRIQVADKNNLDNILAMVDYKVPIMVKSGEVMTTNSIFTDFEDAAKVCSTCDVVIMNGATLKKVAGDVDALRDVEVYAGGKLLIPSDQTLTANQLILRSKEDVVAKADIQGTLARYNTTLLHDKRIPGTRWYFITLPYDCDIADITFRNGEPAVINTDYYIYYYNGEQRAATGQSSAVSSVHYQPYEGSTLEAGKGYIFAVEPSTGHTYAEIRFPMKDANLKKTSTTVSVRAWGGDKSDEELRPNHKGWNLIGNPFLNTYGKGNLDSPLLMGTLEQGPDGKYTLNTTGAKNVRHVYVPINGGYTDYTPVAVGSQDLDPFLAYFAQIAGNPSDELNVEFSHTNVAKASIIRRAFDEEEMDDTPVWVALDLFNQKNESDETTLLVSNQFTDGYDMMDDLLRWRGGYYQYYSKPVLASRNNAGEMAVNALPDVSAAAGVPLNYYAQQAGEYTFSLSDRYDLTQVTEAVLFDSQENRWIDLLTDDYTFSTAKGNNTTRFTLSVTVKRAPKVVTDLDALGGDLRLTAHGNTLILSGAAAGSRVWVYDMSGKLVNSSMANGNSLRLSVPAAGVYNVRVEATEGNVTLRGIVK